MNSHPLKTHIPALEQKPQARVVPSTLDNNGDPRERAFWQSLGGLRDAPQLTDLPELARAIRAHARSL